MSKSRKEILQVVEKFKKNSPSYQAFKKIEEEKYEQEHSLCPSEEFVDKLFKEVANSLGIDYTKKK